MNVDEALYSAAKKAAIKYYVSEKKIHMVKCGEVFHNNLQDIEVAQKLQLGDIADVRIQGYMPPTDDTINEG